jgi:5'-nucleotidase
MAESAYLILLTNDDGLASPGLAAAVRAVRDLGDLLIVAPAEQQSGMGRSMPGHYSCAITRHILTIDGVMYPAYAVDGSPAQAVLHALLSLADRRPALTIAGINHGENLGTGTTISGTVGAALQAGDMGVPGLAVSLEVPPAFHYNHNSGDLVDWSSSIYFTRYFAQRLLRHGLPHGVHAVKVDIPAEATPRTPWRVTRQSLQPYYNSVTVERELQFGVPRPLTYRVQIDWETLEPDSDIWAFVRDRVVSVTPLTLDLSGGIDLSRFAAMMSDP